MKNISSRFLTALCALILSVSSLWAVPAFRGWQERTLADGTTVTLRQIGDEFYHYWETQDGKIAKEQPDGTFVVTNEDRPTGEQIAARRKASKMYQSKPRKAIGERNFAPKGLVILVQFQNVSFKSANNATAFDNMLNQEGYSYGGATGSAKDYFKAQSNGQYVPQFDVFGPVTLPNNLVYYGEEGTINGSSEHDMYIADFVIDAVKAADDAGCNFANYDSDNDGYVDVVYLFYAGKGQAAGGTSETIWPHNWELESALYYKQTHGTSGYYYNDTYPYAKNLPRLDGKYINNYVCSAELKNSGNRSGIGTLCHEFSHVLGLPDYYDTKYGENNDNGITPGEWSLMDQGSYNGDEMTPPNYSIFDKYFMGWATPKFLAKDAAANVTLTTGYDDAYQITGGTSGPLAYTNTNTIYYIENRQKTGWDAEIPGSGMLVWKVQYKQSIWEDNAPNNTAGNPRCTIVPADGKTNNYGNQSDMFPTSSVKTFKPFTGCDLTAITKSGSNVTFLYNGGVDCHSVVTNATGCTISPSVSCVENGNALTATITPTDATYDYTSLTVTRGSTTLTSGTHYTLSSDKKSLTINASAITGSSSDAITITAVWTKNRYKYEMLGENCTAELSGTVNKNAALNLTITPASGYSLADAACWEVTMGGSALTYGTGFTYTGTTFSIASVTGDVEIMAYGLHSVTWMANNSTYTTNVAVDNKITLPDNPADCSGANGKKFVGWTESSSVSGSAPADLFTTAGGKTVTANTTYYAVYAAASGSGSTSKSYSFNITANDFNTTSYAANDNEKTTTATASDASTMDVKWTSNTVMKNGSNIQFKKSAGLIYNSTDLGTIKSVTITSSAGSFTTYYGTSEQPSSSTTVGGGFFQIKVGGATGTVSNIAVTFEKTVSGGTSYSDYSLTCTAPEPCSNQVNISKGTPSNGSFSIDKTGSQDNCSVGGLVVTVSGITPAEGYEFDAITQTGIASGVTIDQENKTVTYAKDIKGSSTINVTFKEKTKYAIRFFNNGSQVGTTQNLYNGQTATKPSPDPEACTGYTFVGWWTANLAADNTTAKTWVTDFTVSGAQDYYAVYSHTETSGGGSPTPAQLEASYSSHDGWTISGTAGSSYWILKDGASITSPVIADLSTVTSITFKARTYGGSSYNTVNVTTSGSANVGSASASSTSMTNKSISVSGLTGSGSIVFSSSTTSSSNGPGINDIVINYSTGGGGSSTTYYTTSPDCTPVTTYTVTYMVCGAPFTTQNYAEGASLVLPDPAPEENAGKSFYGWTETEHYTGDSAPTIISAGTQVNADATYYAVFH